MYDLGIKILFFFSKIIATISFQSIISNRHKNSVNFIPFHALPKIFNRRPRPSQKTSHRLFHHACCRRYHCNHHSHSHSHRRIKIQDGPGLMYDQKPRSPDFQMPRSPDAQKSRCPETQKPRCPKAQMPRSPDAQIPRSPDAQKPRCPKAQMPRRT